MAADSDSFPRGNRATEPTKSVKRQHPNNLFSAEKPPKAKKVRTERTFNKNETNTEDNWQASLKLGGTLIYPKLQTGMIVLACVKSITNFSIQVEMPGFTYAMISIKDISDEFTKELTNKLKEKDSEEPVEYLKKLFEVGALVPVKIMSHEYDNENGHQVKASLNPKDVNSERNHTSFKKGLTIWGSIASELDHGYEVSVGVKSCRVFLPSKNVPNNKKYEVGQPLFCIIHKFEQTSNVTTLSVSAKKEHLDKIELEDNVYLDNIIPGTKVSVLVDHKLEHGIKGTFFENCFGYLDESQMFSLNLNKVREASTLSVYVLYVEPITKVTYLTTHGFDVKPEASLEVGTITNCEIVSVRPNGLCLKINNEKGYITNKRLLNSLGEKAEMEDVRKKYAVGNKQRCRILDFNRMEQIYVCTFEKQLLNEKIFNAKNLELGQLVSVKVAKIIPAGLIVSAGQLRGFVPNLHITDAEYTENLKNKFTVGQTAKARVLSLPNEGNPVFTIKKTMVESDKCLTRIEDAKVNAQFVGMIVHTKLTGALVAFYGGITGWIRAKDLNLGAYANPKEYFFRGQVVNVYVIGIKDDKLLVSIHSQTNRLSKKIKVGKCYQGRFVEANDEGVIVDINAARALIPLSHLSVSPDYCQILTKCFNEGDLIKDMVCLSNETATPIMSRREVVKFRKNTLKMKKFEEMKEGMVLQCYFKEKTEDGIFVRAFLTDFNKDIFISNAEKFEYYKFECIRTKVVSIDHETRELVLCEKSLGNDDLDASLNLLQQIIEDRQHIIRFGRNDNWKLMEYKIGQRVEGTARKDGHSLVVSLDNGTNGIVPNCLTQGKVKKNAKVQGVILDYDFVNDQLVICLKETLKEKISEIQNGKIEKKVNENAFVDVLHKTGNYQLSVLRDILGNQQLCFLPPGSSLGFDVKLKVVIIKATKKGGIICVPKRAWLAHLKLKKSREHFIEKLKRIKEEENDKVKIEGEEDEAYDSDVEIKEEEQDEMEIDENNDVEVDSETEMQVEEQTDDISEDDEDEEDEEEIEEKPAKVKQTGPLLSGVQSFFSADDATAQIDDSSSSDDEMEDDADKKKKKKLTAAERAELARQEEERISKIEKELADASSTTPQSAEQFDRLLLAQPNSSELWLKYIAMHVATTELEKARAVGKRALDTINMTLVQEKFNIWIALLNLENMYGTKESFDELFEKAVKFNDSLEIYLSVIKMLANAGKLSEMEEKIKKVRGKEKQNIKMWLEVGSVYYSLGDFRKARNIKEAALKSIVDNKRQFDLIVKFAIMEFHSGELEQAIANFETIIESFPSKVNIWTIYVDQLIKKEKIDLARKLLERAVSQRLALKNMKVLFQKYLSFEEKYGTPESAQEVRQRAADYVKSMR